MDTVDILCSSCGEEVLYSDVFCMRCGEPNLLFRMEIFKTEYDGKNVLEVIVEEGCRFDHPGIQEDIYGDHLEIYLKYPYCSLCGSNLVGVGV